MHTEDEWWAAYVDFRDNVKSEIDRANAQEFQTRWNNVTLHGQSHNFIFGWSYTANMLTLFHINANNYRNDVKRRTIFG